MNPNFGPLQGIVKRCERRRRPAKVMIIGPNASGKTLSAVRLGAGLVGAGGIIGMISCGEAAAEELYAEVASFYHVDALDPALVERAKKAGGRMGGRMAWDAAGTDPRAALFAVRSLIPAVGPEGVLIIDSASDIWEGVKARVDGLTGGDKKMNGPAWQAASPVLEAVWDALSMAPCHVIVCVRCKSEAVVEEQAGGKVTVHYPTTPEMRERDRFRMDVRIYLDTMHRARFEGRLDVLNGKSVAVLTEEVGKRIGGLLAGPEGAPRRQPAPTLLETPEDVEEGPTDQAMMETAAPPVEARPHPRIESMVRSDVSLGAVCWYLAARDKPAAAPTAAAATAWAEAIDERAWAKHGPAISAAIDRRLAVIGPDLSGWMRRLDGPLLARALDTAKKHGVEGHDPGAWPVDVMMGLALALAEEKPKAKKLPPGEAALWKALDVPGGEDAVKLALAQVGAPWPTEDSDKGELAYTIEKNCQASACHADTVALLCDALAGTGEI